MSSTRTKARSEASEPRRALRSDFTERALRNALTAKRRAAKQQRLQALSKELFTTKSINFLRTVPGAALAVAVVATGSMGVYALTNWFGGNVTVSQKDPTVFSVDLSGCKGNLPPGVEPTTDRHEVQFKIMGSPHISADQLQQDLLGECESSAVTEFYAQKFPDAGFSSTGHVPQGQGAHSFQYRLLPGVVTAIADGTVTLNSTGSKGDSFGTKTFTLGSSLSVYSAGQSAVLNDLRVGDNVMFVAHAASVTAPLMENETMLDRSDVQVVSLFKTQYNDGMDSSFDYQASNVMPLDSYNQLPDGKPYK